MRESFRQLAPDMGARPVELRHVAREDGVPVDRPAGRDGLPVGDLLGVPERFLHVMARPEAELLQRCLQRERSGAPETGSDDRQRHGLNPAM